MKLKITSVALAVVTSLLLLGCPNPVTDPLKSTNADLSDLTVSEGTLSPDFAAGTTAYSVSVPNATTSITVTGTKADSNATLSANNEVAQSLSVGANPITITVTAQDGTTTKNYVVTVNRAGSSNADLSDLTVSEGTLSPDFAAGTTAYSVSVPNATTSITVTGTKADSNATLSANNEVAQSLSVGANPITITVTAQDGTTTKNYVVTVNRAGSSNADLSDLTVSEGTLSPDFAAGTTAYSVSVPNATTSITVTGTKADSNATLSANNEVAQSLSVGANPITITVTAQDGTTTKNYVVTVNRAGSSNADLSDLTVSEGTLNPTFSAGITDYSVIVPNEIASITITGTLSDSKATISTNNSLEQQLIEGYNSINLVVNAEDGYTIKTYNILVLRQTVNRLISPIVSTIISVNDGVTITGTVAQGYTDVKVRLRGVEKVAIVTGYTYSIMFTPGDLAGAWNGPSDIGTYYSGVGQPNVGWGGRTVYIADSSISTYTVSGTITINNYVDGMSIMPYYIQSDNSMNYNVGAVTVSGNGNINYNIDNVLPGNYNMRCFVICNSGANEYFFQNFSIIDANLENVNFTLP